MKKEFTISNIQEHPLFQNHEVLTAFADFLSMRKKIKKPATARAEALLMLKLIALSNEDAAVAVKVLDQSILNCWQDLYPLRGI